MIMALIQWGQDAHGVVFRGADRAHHCAIAHNRFEVALGCTDLAGLCVKVRNGAPVTAVAAVDRDGAGYFAYLLCFEEVFEQEPAPVAVAPTVEMQLETRVVMTDQNERGCGRLTPLPRGGVDKRCCSGSIKTHGALDVCVCAHAS